MYSSQRGPCKEIQGRLRVLAEEIVDSLSAVDEQQGKDLMGGFLIDVTTLFASRNGRKTIRRRQAEGMAAAKAQGVRLGRPLKALPENFEELHQAWRSGKITLQKASDISGMPRSSFHNAVLRVEKAEAEAKAREAQRGDVVPPEETPSRMLREPEGNSMV